LAAASLNEKAPIYIEAIEMEATVSIITPKAKKLVKKMKRKKRFDYLHTKYILKRWTSMHLV